MRKSVLLATLFAVGIGVYALIRLFPVGSAAAAANSTPVETIDSEKLRSYFSQLRVDIRSNLFRTFRELLDSHSAHKSVVDHIAAAHAVATTPAPPKEPEKKVVEIQSLGGLGCLDSNPIQYGPSGVKMWNCHQGKGGPYQMFSLNADGQVVSPTERCLQAPESNTAPVSIEVCVPKSPAQKWKWMKEGTTRYGVLKNEASNRCLTPNHNGSAVHVLPCTSACDMRWHVSKAEVASTETVKATTESLSGTKKDYPRAGKILCWVLTMPKSHSTAAKAVNDTWGPDCDILLFMTTQNYPGLNTVALDIGKPESREALWAKSQNAWMHVYFNYLDKADFFLKADDDTYVVMPYLHEFLMDKNKDDKMHWGRRFQMGGRPGDSNAYFSGGAGILLTRGAVKALGDKAVKDMSVWSQPETQVEDFGTSVSLRNAGVQTGTSVVDKEGRQKFLTLGIHSEPGYIKEESLSHWIWSFAPDSRNGRNCCSTHWITSHYCSPELMYYIHDIRTAKCDRSTDQFPYLEIPERT